MAITPDAPPTAADVVALEKPDRSSFAMGLAPKTVEEGWRMAGFIAATELVPKQFRNKQADVFVGIQYAMELGFAPLQGLQSIAVINGRPSLWGDGLLALVMASPLYQDHDEYFEVRGERRAGLTVEDLKLEDTAAVCTFTRRGKPHPVTRRFSIGQARKANLLTKDGPWKEYPDRMLQMRARTFAARDAFPDVLRGVTAAEELLDAPPTIEHELPAPVAPLQPRRASEIVAPPVPTTPVLTTSGGLRVISVTALPDEELPSAWAIVFQKGTGAELRCETPHEALAREARSFVGTDHDVRATWHEAGPTALLDGLAIDEPSLFPTR